MEEKYRRFYEAAGRCYPEDEITYSSLSGIVRKKWVVDKMSALPAGRLLDCGCNVGRLGSCWGKGPVCGVDVSRSLLRRGKKLFPRVSFVHGDARQLDFIRPGTIDSAIAIEIIEHLDRPEAMLAGLHRIIRPGGRLLITCPGYSGRRPRYLELGIVRSFGVNEGPDGDRYLHTAYKPDELAGLVARAGFAVLEKGSFEKEMRVWNKMLITLMNLSGSVGALIFPHSRLNYLLLKAMHRMELDMFQALDLFGFAKILKTVFREGRRTYVLARKE